MYNTKTLRENLKKRPLLVLFGAGQRGGQILSALSNSGIQPFYFVDNDRSITEKLWEGRNYAVHSPVKLQTEDKSKLMIIITTMDKDYYNQIRNQLNEMSLTECIAGNYQLMCRDILNSVRIHQNGVAFCCRKGGCRPQFDVLGTPEETIDNFLDKRNAIIGELANGGDNTGVSAPCLDCPDLEMMRFVDTGINSVHLTILPAVCQARCIYCDNTDYRKTVDEARLSPIPKQIIEMIGYLKKRGAIDHTCHISGTYGEITISPYKDLLYDAVEQHKVSFCTNAFIFDQRLADSLKNNNSSVVVDIDSGTRETFKIVKGSDIFDKVVENLKAYRKHGKVQMKYIIIPGVNSDNENIDGTINILKELDITRLRLSYDFKSLQRMVLYPLVNFISKLESNDVTPIVEGIYSETVEEFKKLAKIYYTGNEGIYESKYEYLKKVFIAKYMNDYQGYRDYLFCMEFEDLLKCFKYGVRVALLESNHQKKIASVLKKLNIQFHQQEPSESDIIFAPEDTYTDRKYNGRVLDISKYLSSYEPAEMFLRRTISDKYLLRESQVRHIQEISFDFDNQLELHVLLYYMMFEDLAKCFNAETVFALMDNHHLRKNIRVLEKLNFKFYKHRVKDADIVIASREVYADRKYHGRVLDVREYLSSFEDAEVFLKRTISDKFLLSETGCDKTEVISAND